MNFQLGTFKTDLQKSVQLPFTSVATAPITLTHALTANSTQPLFLTFGVKFFRQTNGVMLPLMDSGFAVLEILGVSKV